MTAMTSSQANVGCLVLNVALGKDGKRLQRRIEGYLAKNGTEWTCRRLKAIYQVALNLRSGERDKAKKVLQDTSIAYHKQTLIPKGIEGVAVRRFVEAQRPQVVKRCASALRYYTGLQLDHDTPAQKAKALKSITGPSTATVSSSYCHFRGTEDIRLSLQDRGKRVVTLADKPIGPKERHAEHLKATSKYYSRYKVPVGLRKYPYSSMVMSFMTEPEIPPILEDMVPCSEMRQQIKSDPWYTDHPQLYVGEITVIQEQGCKARVVAKPSAWLQLAFMPAHRRIADIAERVFPVESCCYAQVNGAYAILDHMQKGNTVYCTDLSSATDRFPRDYTLGILEYLGYRKYADALKWVCERPFKSDISPSGEVRYSVGQPMGLYGSFPEFHLSNLVLADAAVREVSVPWDRPKAFADGSYFKVVGDDIAFSDFRVSECYRNKMSAFGVDISEPKSFAGRVAEFAGFICVQTNSGPVCFRPYKVPAQNTVTNPIQLLDSLGLSGFRSSRIASSKYWIKQAERYQKTKSSRDLALDPLVPGEKDPFVNANRGGNRELVVLSTAIAARFQGDLPDLSGSTQINTIPLFREQGMFDFYGFNPTELVKDEATYRVDPMRRRDVSIAQDPLMREVRKIESGIQPGYRFTSQPKVLRKIDSPPPSTEEKPDPTPVETTITTCMKVDDDRRKLLASIQEAEERADRVRTPPSDLTMDFLKP